MTAEGGDGNGNIGDGSGKVTVTVTVMVVVTVAVTYGVTVMVTGGDGNSRVARHPRTIYFLHAQAWLENNRFGDLFGLARCQ